MPIDFKKYLGGYTDPKAPQGGATTQKSLTGIWGAIPEGANVSLQNIQGLDGYQNLFKKQGNQLVPILGQASGEIIQAPLTSREVGQIGGIRPLSYGIGGGQTEQQAESLYQGALGDSTTDRVLPSGQVISGSQAIAQQASDRNAILNAPTGESLGYNPAGVQPQAQSFAEIRAGGDPNDLITIEKNGRQREVSRSALSDSFFKAGFKVVGETGKQIQFGAEAVSQGTTQPNFIDGLTQAQQDSITNLMASRPSSQWSATDLKNWNYATNGQALPSGFPKTKPSDEITTDDFTKQEDVSIPGGTPTVDLSSSLVMGANTSIAEIMKMLTPPDTEADQQQQSLLDNMANLVGENAKMASDQLTAEQSAGLPELRQQFADINAQILSKTAEYNVLQTTNKNKPITMNSIIGNERAIMNAQASDIGLLQARALGLQGQIETAQATVDRAIDLKYSTIQAGLEVYQAQLNALMPTLNKQEKLQAQAQQLLLDERQQAINDKKAEEKNIQSAMLDYINSGGTDNNVMNRIQNAGSYESAIKILASNMPEGSQDLDTQIVTAGGRSLLVNKQTGETIKDLGSAYKAGDGTADDGVYKTKLENLSDGELESTLQGALDKNGDVDTSKLNNNQLIELQRRDYFDAEDEDTRNWLEKLADSTYSSAKGIKDVGFNLID